MSHPRLRAGPLRKGDIAVLAIVWGARRAREIDEAS
jgi:hypothetical protein